jgi:hypothetical protein
VRWEYDSSDGNCWKSGKLSLGAILLKMAWKLSQMMFPSLVLSTSIYRTPLLMSLKPEWIPLGECTPLLMEKYVPVIPPSELDEICLKMTALVYWEMGLKVFLEFGLLLALERQMCLPKVSHVQVWKMCPSLFLHWNMMRSQEKYVPFHPLKWVRGKSRNSP